MRPASSPSTRACSSTSSRLGSATADAFPDPRGIRLPSLLRRARPRWRARRVGTRCWLLDLEVPVGLHIVVPALLGVVNRLAARRFEREPVTGLLTGRAGYVTLAIAFGALVSAGVLAVLASAWVAGSLLGALSAEADLDAWMPELARLTAPHGVFAVLGNHDRRAGADRVAAALARWSGWRLLRDEVATIGVAGSRFHLVGLEERPEGRAADALPDLVARVPGGEPFVVLAHRPSVLPVAAAVGAPLVLAGHTHGGQLAFPGVPQLNVARLLQMGFEAGCYTRDGTLLHVNRGLGTSGQRVRVGVPREIRVRTLTAP